ncbi:hypothetical protein [Roseicyclus persicicus]|uniref:Uncharacterized protein n=1 Tax=Roseicyclus persicicus TaxID=2650661 RepID=A0A7X6GXW8_9RHOB|nr:hypothetical protein [Roseibacterium persicicum]NKX43162.1 hypothetical protein [Roseibacterium persicicum]
MTPILKAAAMAAVVLGTGAATVSVMNSDIADMPVPSANWQAGHELDGMDFAVTAVINENGAEETDVLRFADGRFHSVDCETYCNFGWSGYQTWTEGEVIHFTATTRCPTAPHTVVWLGQVVDGRIEVAMSWTTRRWYWTQQITGTGHGTLSADAAPPTSG